MATELTMPQMGYDMQEGTVVRWLKPEGAPIAKGEPVAEIETDKAVVEFQSYADGLLQRILVSEGETVKVGAPIAVVGAEGEDVVAAPPEMEVEEDIVPPDPVSPPPPPPPPPARPERTFFRASPVARKIAEERGIDLAEVIGTGPGGRITREDVEQASPQSAESEPQEAMEPADAPQDEAIPLPADLSAEPPPEEDDQPEPPVETEEVAVSAGEVDATPDPDAEPLSRMRQQIARVTVGSKTEIPHFYVSTEVDMTGAMEMRTQVNSSPAFSDVRVSVNDLILKACVEALKLHPKFNATFTSDGVKMNERINVGIAVAGDESLIVPAISDAQDMSLRDIAVASRDLAQRAKGGTITAAEYTSGTFSVSNLGMFDVSAFVAIIHPPQSAVLAVGAVAKRPVVKGDRVEVAEMMTATVSADHRVVDGAEGAQFVGEIKTILENPYRLLV